MDDKEIRVGHDQEESVGLSRRAFLKGGGALAGVAMLAGAGLGLTGCAPEDGTEGGDGAAALDAHYTVYDTDLLIIGGGFGALSAAYQAIKSGKTVTLVDKGPYGFSGGCGMNWDVIYTWCPSVDMLPKQATFKRLTNQEAAKEAYLTDPNADALGMLMNQGQTAPRRNEDGTVKLTIDYPQIKGLEGCFPRHSQDKLAQSQMITIHDRVMLTEVLVNDGVCLGAMGVHLPSGEMRVYRANATILAAGSNGWVYGWSTVAAHSFGSPDNTSDIEVAAYRHGAPLGDCEYGSYDLITTYPTGIAYAFNSGLGADANEWEYILDKDGKKMLANATQDDIDRFQYDRPFFNQTLAKEIAAGRGTASGGVLIDLSAPETVASFRECYARSIDLFKDNFGIDVTTQPLEIGFEMYEHGGAPVIDKKMMSAELPGLFCVRGAGVYGESGGTSVNMNNVFGSYATRCALEYLNGFSAPETIDWAPVADEYARLHELRTREASDGLRPPAVRQKIQKACETCLGVLRDKPALEAAAAELARIRTEDLPKMVVGAKTMTYNMDWKQAIENYNMLEIAEASVRATLMREETRGQYLRVDFPEKDDTNWNCMIAVSRAEDGSMAFAKREMPVVTF